jgi:hypothetical protein
MFLIDCDTVQSGPGLKNIETRPDRKPGRSGPGTRRAAKPAKKTSY